MLHFWLGISLHHFKIAVTQAIAELLTQDEMLAKRMSQLGGVFGAMNSIFGVDKRPAPTADKAGTVSHLNIVKEDEKNKSEGDSEDDSSN